MKKYQTLIFAAIISLFFAVPTYQALAASDYLIFLDWSASTYAPPSYTSKAKTMPINGSTITVYANIFSETKKSNISQYQRISPNAYEFSWYVNDKKISSKTAQDVFFYNVPRGILMKDISIRVEIANENSSIGSKGITIPLWPEPEIRILKEQNGKIIPISVPSLTTGKGSIIKLVPLPYFFNVRTPLQLSFLWYEGRKKLPSSSYAAGVFEMKLPNYAASDNFKSVIYNTTFDLELAKKNIDITSK